jgi:hypothetical protein
VGGLLESQINHVFVEDVYDGLAPNMEQVWFLMLLKAKTQLMRKVYGHNDHHAVDTAFQVLKASTVEDNVTDFRLTLLSYYDYLYSVHPDLGLDAVANFSWGLECSEIIHLVLSFENTSRISGKTGDVLTLEAFVRLIRDKGHCLKLERMLVFKALCSAFARKWVASPASHDFNIELLTSIFVNTYSSSGVMDDSAIIEDLGLGLLERHDSVTKQLVFCKTAKFWRGYKM